MERRLAPHGEPRRGGVGIGVAGEQDRLVEDERGVPDGGGPAQERQHHPGEHRLDQEQESGADEDGGGVEAQHVGVPHEAKTNTRGGQVLRPARAAH